MAELSPRHRAALAYAADGIPVFPCVVNGKEPATGHGKDDRTTDRARIDAWWLTNDYNVAIVPEDAGWCVVDIDPINDGERTWTQFEHNTPKTRVVITPSGGRHLYFAGSLRMSAGKYGLGEGIDTRGRDSYVLIPPSYVVETKKGYRGAYTDAGGEIVDVPQWITAKMAREDVAPRPADPDVELDLPYSIEQAERWLRQQPPAATGNASDTFYRYACRLKDFALSHCKILEMLHSANPSYEEDDIAVRVGNAFNYGQNEPGSDRPKPAEEVFAAVEPPAPIDDHGFRQIAWLRAQVFPPTQWDWHKRIPSFKPIIVTGPPKTGKTTFLLNLAAHVAAGAEFLGATTRPTDIVMLLAEDEYGQVRDNLLAIVQAHGFDPSVLDRLHIRSVLSEPVEGGHWLARVDDQGNATGTQFMREIVAPYLAALDRPIWMVDPLVEFVAFNRYSEQAPRGLVHWLNNVSRIGNGVTPLITDHPTIASVEQGRDIGGSVQMEGSFPTVAAIKAGKWSQGLVRQRPMSFALKYARYSPEHSVDFYRVEGSPAFSSQGVPGTTAEDRRNAVYRYVIEGLAMEPMRLVQQSNAGFGPQALAGEIGIEEKDAKLALSTLTGLGWLQYELRQGKGHGHLAAHYERGNNGPKLSSLEPLEPVSGLEAW